MYLVVCVSLCVSLYVSVRVTLRVSASVCVLETLRNLCVSVCIFVCLCVSVRLFASLRMSVCLCVSLCVFVRFFVYLIVFVSLFVFLCVSLYTRTREYAQTQMEQVVVSIFRVFACICLHVVLVYVLVYGCVSNNIEKPLLFQRKLKTPPAWFPKFPESSRVHPARPLPLGTLFFKKQASGHKKKRPLRFFALPVIR